jgi:hypothetical protein
LCSRAQSPRPKIFPAEPECAGQVDSRSRFRQYLSNSFSLLREPARFDFSKVFLAGCVSRFDLCPRAGEFCANFFFSARRAPLVISQLSIPARRCGSVQRRLAPPVTSCAQSWSRSGPPTRMQTGLVQLLFSCSALCVVGCSFWVIAGVFFALWSPRQAEFLFFGPREYSLRASSSERSSFCA